MALALEKVALLLSAGIWVLVGAYKLTHRDRMVGVIRAHGIPFPVAAFWLSVCVELGGAALLLIPNMLWLAVLAWLAFLCVATPIFHGALIRDGAVDYQQLVHVGKNLSIAGGLVALLILDGTVPRFLVNMSTWAGAHETATSEIQIVR